MDDEDDYYRGPGRGGGGSGPQQIVLPTAPRAALGPDMSDERIPKDPPYTAYVANLPYDIMEEDLMNFFSKLNVRFGLNTSVPRTYSQFSHIFQIKSVRLPRDGDADSGRLKGFGYADFEDREGWSESLATRGDEWLGARD